MTTRTKSIICVLLFAVSFALGRYTTPVKIKTVIQVVEHEKIVDNTQKDAQKHVKTTITETTAPDGTKTKVTVISDNSDTKTDDSKTIVDDKKSTSTTEVTRGGSQLTVSALAGFDIHSPAPVYGAHVQKSLIGPLSVGAFGLTNGTVGVSLGLSF